MKKNYNKNANDYMCSMTLGDLQSKRQSFQFISRDTYAAYDILAANDYMNIVLFASHDQSNVGVQLSSKITRHIDDIFIKNMILKAAGLISKIRLGITAIHVYACM